MIPFKRIIRPAALALALLFPAAVHAQNAQDQLAACSAGDQDACLKGAQLAQAAGDNALLMTLSQTGCKLGNTISCSDEGMMLIMGVAGKTDIKRGVELVQGGCDKGYFRACANLGYLYYTGTGIGRDVPRAAQLYQRGCDGGSAAACRNLGLMVLEGEVSQSGTPSADDLFDRACELGEMTAC